MPQPFPVLLLPPRSRLQLLPRLNIRRYSGADRVGRIAGSREKKRVVLPKTQIRSVKIGRECYLQNPSTETFCQSWGSCID